MALVNEQKGGWRHAWCVRFLPLSTEMISVNSCFIMDDRGYLIAHRGLIEPNDRGPLEEKHITHKARPTFLITLLLEPGENALIIEIPKCHYASIIEIPKCHYIGETSILDLIK